MAPALNVWLAQKVALRGMPIEFGTNSDYVAWQRKAEICICKPDDYRSARPLTVQPVDIELGQNQWGASARSDTPGPVQFEVR